MHRLSMHYNALHWTSATSGVETGLCSCSRDRELSHRSLCGSISSLSAPTNHVLAPFAEYNNEISRVSAARRRSFNELPFFRRLVKFLCPAVVVDDVSVFRRLETLAPRHIDDPHYVRWAPALSAWFQLIRCPVNVEYSSSSIHYRDCLPMFRTVR